MEHKHRAVAVIAVALLVTLFGPFVAADDPKSATLRIALSASLFHEVPDAKAHQAMQSMKELVSRQTGRRTEGSVEKDIDKLAKQLAEGKRDLVVFLGYEFAWARQKNPKLRPLVIAVSGDQAMRAHVMARQGSTAAKLTDLKGQAFALPKESRAHCRLLVERQCKAQGKSPQDFFAPLTTPGNVEDALDDVLDGVVQATVIDSFGLEAYKRRKPGRFAKLKEIQKSEVFPAPVVAYQDGTFDEATLKQFREDLLRTIQDAEGQRLLGLWKLTGFAQVPNDYERTVTEILRAYPP
jgi:ABC-type phosphate/phosphonate transport system substrate-binding protein